MQTLIKRSHAPDMNRLGLTSGCTAMHMTSLCKDIRGSEEYSNCKDKNTFIVCMCVYVCISTASTLEAVSVCVYVCVCACV